MKTLQNPLKPVLMERSHFLVKTSKQPFDLRRLDKRLVSKREGALPGVSWASREAGSGP